MIAKKSCSYSLQEQLSIQYVNKLKNNQWISIRPVVKINWKQYSGFLHFLVATLHKKESAGKFRNKYVMSYESVSKYVKWGCAELVWMLRNQSSTPVSGVVTSFRDACQDCKEAVSFVVNEPLILICQWKKWPLHIEPTTSTSPSNKCTIIKRVAGTVSVDLIANEIAWKKNTD